ncbi:hypothetical protein PybrP1_012676 [[Pythium] brassicae (nom. inval.)]|nr:hypothetical protein PybrP1_012676 [[Pythium] brassicae (nom. inval.)]
MVATTSGTAGVGASDVKSDPNCVEPACKSKLHSMGAYFPDKPSKEHQEKARMFVEALALMYPCVHCAEDFQNEVKKSPPRVDSRVSFSQWLCEQHNVVNRKIGKPLFSCSMEKLDERWRKGRPACWGEDGDEDAIPASLGRDE